jgi:hypothetical protein
MPSIFDRRDLLITGRRGAVAVAIAVVALIVTAAPAQAYWRTAAVSIASVRTGTLGAPTAVTVPATAYPDVTVSWTAPAGTPAATGYYVTRTTGTSTSAACGSSATALIAITSCSDTAVPIGAAYTYKVVAVYRSWTATSAASGTVTIPSPAKLAFTAQPSNAMAGVTIAPPITVTVQTAVGATFPVKDMVVSLAVTGNGTTLSGTTSVGTSNGVATFGTVSVQSAGTYTLTASSSGLTSAVSTSFTIAPGLPAKLLFVQQPTNTNLNATITPAVTAMIADTYGNQTTSTASVTIAIDNNVGLLGLGAGALNGTKTVNAVSGLATFSNLSIGPALLLGGTGNGYTLKITSGSFTATSTPFNIT